MTQTQAFDFEATAPAQHSTQIDTVPAAPQPLLKRRVREAGQRHGRAFGNIGVVTTSYTRGFAEGFVASFKD
jgi:hypothetical protein